VRVLLEKSYAARTEDHCHGIGLKEERLPLSEHWHQSEEPFRLFVESVQDYAIFMLDTDGRVATWNAGAERAKGYKASEIVGQHFSHFYTDEDVRTDKPQRLLSLALKQGRAEDEGWRVRNDGSKFWAKVTITAVRGATGKLIGFGKVTRDLTEPMLARKSLEESRRKLQVASGIVASFAAYPG
jgi:PAS domain S-box-containing protein